MASMLTSSQSQSHTHLLGKSYETALNQSIEALLTSLRNPNPLNPTDFASEFQQFVQSKADPPLESIWVYTALAFTGFSVPGADPSVRISDIKRLFQLIVSCSASCNSLKSIALLAPVVYKLHEFILYANGASLGSKKERKFHGEIKSLVDSVLGYITVCYNAFDGDFDEFGDFIRPLGDLISFWLVDDGARNVNVESLRAFFPLLNDDVVKRAIAEGCGVIDLAGFVIAEAFSLKLCWKIREDGFGEKMQNELRPWVVGSITGLRSSYSYVTLARMLLEPDMPIASLSNLEHDDGLRKLLFDALILVEYSFLSSESLGKLPTKHAKRVILTKLLATHEAIEFFRGQGDQTKAIAYSNAFSNSSLPSFIIKWIRSEIGDANEPTGSSPRSFLRWILNIENRGTKIFDDDMSKFRTAFNSKEDTEQLANRKGGKKVDSDLFFIDNKGQEEYGTDEDEKMRESVSASFTAAAHSMQASEKGERKRKSKDGKKRKKMKFVKYDVLENSSLSGQRSADPRNGNLGSGSDIENPSSGEDV